MAEERPRVGRSSPPGPGDEVVPVPKPPRQPPRTVAARGPSAVDVVRPATPRADEPSQPDLPDADTVLHEIFTPASVPPARPRSSPPPPVDDPIVPPARITQPLLAQAAPKAVMTTTVALANRPRATLQMARVVPTPPVPHPSPTLEPTTNEPPRPPTEDERFILWNEPDSARASSFRLLRDNLLVERRLPPVVAVTSAKTNEGKTTCAINLAIALAEQTPTRVLLLDANFLEPELASVFAIRPTSVAAPGTDAPWLAPYRIVEVSRGLHVAALVQQSGDPEPRFDSRPFATLIGHLAPALYERIVIDTAALEGAPFVLQLVRLVHATLLAVRGGTTARAVRRAVEQLPKDKTIGFALFET